jgi:hypothetical protein
MGFGDEIMATGMARGAKARGKRIAFGDGKQIIFSPWSEQVFRYNPNIAHPGDELDGDIEWIAHHKGNRLYNRLSRSRDRWEWNLDFRAVPGELFFSDEELKFAESVGSGFVLIEPNVPRHKSVARNKDWGEIKYNAVSVELLALGERVIQFVHDGGTARCSGAHLLKAPSFRHALAVLARAALYIGPEGGLHHGAAAVGIPAVVLFGGFIPPQVTGYPTHTNLTGGAAACGKLHACSHCRAAMDAISVEKVMKAARRFLKLQVPACA